MNNRNKINHMGYIHLGDNGHFSYELADGRITIHAYDKIPEIENQNYIITKGNDNENYLIYSQVGIGMSPDDFYPRNYSQDIDWVIEKYERESKISAVEFDFAELQYFCPSVSVVKQVGNEVVFNREQSTIKEFDIDVGKICCHVSFIVTCDGKYGIPRSHMETISKIIVEFPETDDFEFFERLYYIVDSVFAFLCNRCNTDCLSMVLKGNYPTKTIKNGKIVDVVKPCQCCMYFMDRYREEIEDENIMEKTLNTPDVRVVFQHIEELFKLVSDDIANNDETAYISISSIHPSFRKRKLIDLQLSLHITAAFEFYVRTYLPKMAEEKSHHTDLKMLLREFANKNKGKAKKLANRLEKSVVQEPALKDKIVKVYNGYNDWAGVKECFEEDWFIDDIPLLAQKANEWRNELAHEKRTCKPSIETVKAIRLVEHLNYVIVLRQLGCTDSEIKSFLKSVLARVKVQVKL